MVERSEGFHETPDNRLGVPMSQDVQSILAESRFGGLTLSALRGRADALASKIKALGAWEQPIISPTFKPPKWHSEGATQRARDDMDVLKAEQEILQTFLAEAEAEWAEKHRSVKGVDRGRAGKSRGEVKADRRSALAAKREDELKQNEAAKRELAIYNRQKKTADGQAAVGRKKGPALDSDGRRFRIGETAKEVTFPGSKAVAFTIVADRDQRTNRDVFRIIGNAEVFKGAAYQSSLHNERLGSLDLAVARCAEEAERIALKNDRFQKDPHGAVKIAKRADGGREISVRVHRPFGASGLTKFELNVTGGRDYVDGLDAFQRTYGSFEQAQNAANQAEELISAHEAEKRREEEERSSRSRSRSRSYDSIFDW